MVLTISQFTQTNLGTYPQVGLNERTSQRIYAFWVSLYRLSTASKNRQIRIARIGIARETKSTMNIQIILKEHGSAT